MEAVVRSRSPVAQFCDILEGIGAAFLGSAAAKRIFGRVVAFVNYRFTFVKTNFSLAERSSENTSCRVVTPLSFSTRDTWRVGGLESPSTAATEPSRGVGRDATLSMTRVFCFVPLGTLGPPPLMAEDNITFSGLVEPYY